MERMTFEQALNKLDETLIGDLELKVVLSKALEKQMPKKTMGIGINDKCLVCGRWVNTNHKYCPECGQALDWGDAE